VIAATFFSLATLSASSLAALSAPAAVFSFFAFLLANSPLIAV
jgi:hypothetical protein